MTSELLTRALIALSLIALGAGLYWLLNQALLARLRVRGLRLKTLKPGLPALLYFTAPGCVPCKTYQRPQIESLRRHLGEALQVIEVDATTQPDLADYWGVLSVPTTFIIDSQGRPRRVNHGIISAEALQEQIVDAERAVSPVRELIGAPNSRRG
jgi:thioredoxin 1